MNTIRLLTATATTALVLTGCASTDTAKPDGAKVSSAKQAAQPTYVPITGSRIPARTTEKLVKSAERDLADEPVRTAVSPIPRGNQ
jgi:outer membrane lipoprotein SlyB